jgi:hypothetical protein
MSTSRSVLQNHECESMVLSAFPSALLVSLKGMGWVLELTEALQGEG